ncbi:MAG TPA: hypothetical protein VNY04_03510 [Chthoniobacterales bacterium]|jgi:hypothetical protein|nr:hypothetical protein [Chthoniobacterales bacterium]
MGAFFLGWGLLEWRLTHLQQLGVQLISLSFSLCRLDDVKVE